MNAVLGLELRTRFRGRRSLALVTVWMAGLAVVTYLFYLLGREVARSGFGFGMLFSGGYVGRFVFDAVTLLLVSAVILVMPGIAGSSIVIERERQTFPLLQVTQMTPWQLVFGKFGVSVAFMVLLIVGAAPVAAVPLLFGGVLLSDVAAAFGMLVLLAVVLGAVGTWASARAKSTRAAVAMAYLFALLITFGSGLGMLAETLVKSDVFRGSTGGLELVTAWPNPYIAMVDAVEAPLSISDTPFGNGTVFAPFQAYLLNRQTSPNQEGFGIPRAELDELGRRVVVPERPPVWIYTVAIYLVITIVSLRSAAKHVSAPARRIRDIKRRARYASPT